ncbi:unnamed protein product [Trichogramma brassicae]|uniref:Uncharacterized protein n=1 Tax=Trichogramma brassicae TaxID=86971 RepID=A0A6H5I821_9HYME|nr:unnamed protein product [Trichogramma brassicae]
MRDTHNYLRNYCKHKTAISLRNSCKQKIILIGLIIIRREIECIGVDFQL